MKSTPLRSWDRGRLVYLGVGVLCCLGGIAMMLLL